MAEIHEHCSRCLRPGDCKRGLGPCPLYNCPQDCGVRLHKCKLQEHLEEVFPVFPNSKEAGGGEGLQVCPETLGPCISAALGCPAVVKRRRRGVHLANCPASVLVCQASWGRWPVCSQALPTKAISQSLVHRSF